MNGIPLVKPTALGHCGRVLSGGRVQVAEVRAAVAEARRAGRAMPQVIVGGSCLSDPARFAAHLCA